MYDDEGPTKVPFVPSAPFREMAERIDRNRPEEFAGAFMVVLRDGTQISGMLVDPDDNPAMLLSNAQVKLDLALKELEDRENQARGGRGFR